MRRFIILPLLLTALAAPGALAAPIGTASTTSSFDASKLFTSMTIDDVEAVVKEAGLKYERQTGGNGESIDAESPDGLKYSISLVNCPESGERRCESLNLISYTFNETANMTLKRVNEWNRDQAWGVRGMLFSDGTSGMTMNIAVDGGVTAGWLKARLDNYSYYIKSFSDLIQGVTP